jgi:hypothetical protein
MKILIILKIIVLWINEKLMNIPLPHQILFQKDFYFKIYQ